MRSVGNIRLTFGFNPKIVGVLSLSDITSKLSVLEGATKIRKGCRTPNFGDQNWGFCTSFLIFAAPSRRAKLTSNIE